MQLKNRLPFYFFLLICTGVHAQQATVAGGGIASGSGGTSSFSIGQVV